MTDTRRPYRQETPGALDAAIDRAVRDLTSGEARPGLRNRVQARIDRGRPQPVLWPRLALGSAMVAILVLAVILLRPTDRTPAEPTTQAPQVVTTPRFEPPPLEAPVAEPLAPVAAAKPSPEPRVTRVPISMPRVANVFGERTGRAQAAAAPAEEVVFAELAAPALDPEMTIPPAIVISGIEIAPLQVSPIRVEPLPDSPVKEPR